MATKESMMRAAVIEQLLQLISKEGLKGLTESEPEVESKKEEASECEEPEEAVLVVATPEDESEMDDKAKRLRKMKAMK